MAPWGVSVLICTLAALAQPNPLPPPLSQWQIDQLLRTAQPVRIEVECVRSSLLSTAEINALAQNPAPDPSQPPVGWLLELAANPERTRITWAFGEGRWYVSKQQGGESQLESASDDQNRWMLYRTGLGVRTGQLTITAAGVPYPAGSNIGQDYMLIVRRMAGFGNYNIVDHNPPAVVHTPSLSAVPSLFAHWADDRKVYLQRQGDSLTVINQPAPQWALPSRVIMVTSSFQPPPNRWPLPLYVPQFTTEPDAFTREAWKILSVEPISTADLQALVAVPTPPPGVTVWDFSRPGPFPHDSPPYVWTPDGVVQALPYKGQPGMKMYTILPHAPNATIPSASATAAGSQPPPTPADITDLANAAQTPTAPSARFTWWMILAPALLVPGVLLLLRLWRRPA